MLNLANLKMMRPTWARDLNVHLSWNTKLKIIESSIAIIEEIRSRSKLKNKSLGANSWVGIFESIGLEKTVVEYIWPLFKSPKVTAFIRYPPEPTIKNLINILDCVRRTFIPNLRTSNVYAIIFALE